jgi:ubiquinone/menaquinone biosynthesis C-methylase UbiE
MYQDVNYKEFWEGRERQKLDQLERILMKELLSLPARRLIDVGCGYGRMADEYLHACDQVVMLDSSISLLQQAREKTHGQATYIACDLYHIPFRDASFDRVLNIRVFHHLENGEAALSEFERILAKDGELTFTYCNKANLDRVVSWVIDHEAINPFSLEPGWIWSGFLMHHPRHIHSMLRALKFTEIVERGAGVMDKFAGRFSQYGIEVPPGRRLAPLFAALAIAPWIFVQAKKTSGPCLEEATRPEMLLCCPLCKGDLLHLVEPLGAGNIYYCTNCNRSFPIHDGIIDFLPE